MKNVMFAALSAISAAFLYVAQPQEQTNPLAGQEPASLTQRYRAEIEDKQLENGASEVLATLHLLQEQLQSNTQAYQSLSADLASINSRITPYQEKLEAIVEEKIADGKFVSKTAMDEAIAAMKDATAEAAKTASDNPDGCNCESKFTEIFQRLKALEDATGLTTSMYGSVSSTSSGGSFGSLSSSYNATTTTTSSYAGSYPPVSNVASGGSFGSYTQTSVPVETRTVRVVEPRQPRRVTEVEVAEPQTVVSFDQMIPMTTCGPEGCDTSYAPVQVQAPVQNQSNRRVLFPNLPRNRN